MKTYAGGRSLDGAVVTVDGATLDRRFDLAVFCRAGFGWTYEGDGPRQLALALLADHATGARLTRPTWLPITESERMALSHGGWWLSAD